MGPPPSQGDWNKMIATIKSEVMEDKKVTAVAKVSAAGNIKVASARNTLMARLMDKEGAVGEAARAKAEELCEAARLVVASEERKVENMEDALTKKWDTMILKRKQVTARRPRATALSRCVPPRTACQPCDAPRTPARDPVCPSARASLTVGSGGGGPQEEDEG